MINETVEARLNPSSHLTVVKPHETADDYDTIRHGSGNGGGNDMLERVKKLEEQVAAIGTDIAVIKATLCTKEDLQKELNGQTWKIIIALVVSVLIAVLSKYFIK
ncbi:hypothetical protein [Mixta gaviniae]|uniref:Hemolysin XhlA n=1 Tax=Mixta gaviniae TaxID=665914 RepID=A0A1X1EEJ8_9GAMM|nr:hypothetical protein [Mixta gaviniae]AUX94264.1 hypothetical protein C2E15_15070 [Mixta gaviniae]ORM87355.1 hypothetical protein HA44_01510 [Mixta gaviniae]